MKYEATFMVVRKSPDETTYAKVSATVTSEELRREGPFLRALQEALSRWVDETKEGGEAWERSGNDFNIGDLASEGPSGTLNRRLEAVGIPFLEVETFCETDACRDWTYDTALVTLRNGMPR